MVIIPFVLSVATANGRFRIYHFGRNFPRQLAILNISAQFFLSFLLRQLLVPSSSFRSLVLARRAVAIREEGILLWLVEAFFPCSSPLIHIRSLFRLAVTRFLSSCRSFRSFVAAPDLVFVPPSQMSRNPMSRNLTVK